MITITVNDVTTEISINTCASMIAAIKMQREEFMRDFLQCAMSDDNSNAKITAMIINELTEALTAFPSEALDATQTSDAIAFIGKLV